MNFKYPKSAHLKSQKSIEQLFAEGKRAKSYPLRLLYLPITTSNHHQAGFAVSKRNFKLAVTRNRIKRQLREAYRLNQHLLSEKTGTKFALLFIYTAKEPLDFKRIQKAMVQLLTLDSYENN